MTAKYQEDPSTISLFYRYNEIKHIQANKYKSDYIMPDKYFGWTDEEFKTETKRLGDEVINLTNDIGIQRAKKIYNKTWGTVFIDQLNNNHNNDLPRDG